MKRSQSSAYSMYGRALSHDRFETALSSLLDYIDENENGFEIWDRSLALQQIGNIYLKLGKGGLAKFYFDASVQIDPTSLEAKLGYAIFIGKGLRNHELAFKICDEIISAARAAPQSYFKDNNMSARYFIDGAEGLKNELTSTR
jgi:tetratricopeptide (TPR) repeat protein